MRHRIPEPFVLLRSCSYCHKSFEDGAARHMLGWYPLEQFCTYRCTEKFLADAGGLKRAIELKAGRERSIQPGYQE